VEVMVEKIKELKNVLLKKEGVIMKMGFALKPSQE
jgi:hypothetical protein